MDKTPIAAGGGIELGISSVIVQFNAKICRWYRGHRRFFLVVVLLVCCCGYVGLCECMGFVVCGFFGSAKIVRVFVAARSPHRFHVFFIVAQQEEEEEEEAQEQEEARQQVAGRAAGGTGDVLLSEMFL